MLQNKKMCRRSFIASAGVSGGALICYPINVLGQQTSFYLNIEDYNTINAIKASAKQDFALLCLNPSPGEEDIDESLVLLERLQDTMDGLVPGFEDFENIGEEENWARTNFNPEPFFEIIPLHDEDDIESKLSVSTMHPCTRAVIQVLMGVFRIDESFLDDFEKFLREQNQAIYVEGMASSLEQDDNNKLSNYVELLINNFTINEVIKQAIDTSQSPVARAIRLWLMKRTIPFVGLCLAIMDVGISLIRNRHYILECVETARN